jgi:hypothetical protein
MLRAVPAPDAVRLDPAAAYPEVKTLRARLVARDWAAVRQVLDAAGDPVARTMLIRFGADLDTTNTDGLEAFLREIADNDPEDSAAAAMLAYHLIGIGWEIRSSYRAKYVSREQFASFHEWLRRAEKVLFEAIGRHPADPALWVARLKSARGLSLGLAETRRRYDRLAAIDKHHLPGQEDFLQHLCPKWSGSWELLHPWCREAMLAAPPGALQGGLVADGHIEHWLDLVQEGGRDTARAYLRDEGVHAELREAAERSLWHPDFQRNHGWVRVANYFALAFSVIGDQRAAGAVFTMLGDFGLEVPWIWLNRDAAGAYYASRATALASGRAR